MRKIADQKISKYFQYYIVNKPQMDSFHDDIFVTLDANRIYVC